MWSQGIQLHFTRPRVYLETIYTRRTIILPNNGPYLSKNNKRLNILSTLDRWKLNRVFLLPLQPLQRLLQARLKSYELLGPSSRKGIRVVTKNFYADNRAYSSRSTSHETLDLPTTVGPPTLLAFYACMNFPFVLVIVFCYRYYDQHSTTTSGVCQFI